MWALRSHEDHTAISKETHSSYCCVFLLTAKTQCRREWPYPGPRCAGPEASPWGGRWDSPCKLQPTGLRTGPAPYFQSHVETSDTV